MVRVTAVVATLAVGLLAAGCGAAHRRSVVIPPSIEQNDVIRAYAELRGLGLKPRLDRPITVTSLQPLPLVVGGVIPGPGTRVPVGSSVTIDPGVSPIGSPAVPKVLPPARIPNLLGRPLSAAVDWADRHRIEWKVVALPPVPGAAGLGAPSVFDGYKVTAQRPRAGELLTAGHPIAHGWAVTFLTLHVAAR